MTFARTHVYLPVTTPASDLLVYADVTFLDEGTSTKSAVPLYRDKDATQLLDNPATFAPGIIEVWCNSPLRLDLAISGPGGYRAEILGVDLMPSPEDVAKAAVLNEIAEAPQVGRVLISDGSSQYWDYLLLIAAHDHDGIPADSTKVDLGNSVMSPGVNQTWVGNVTPGAAADAANSSALGSDATPAANHSTLLGAGAVAFLSGEDPGDRATVIGLSAFAAKDSTTIGDGSGQNEIDCVSLPFNAADELDVYVNPDSVGLRNAFFGATTSEVGNAIAKPAVPAGVTNPLWLRGDTLVPGDLVTSGSVQVAGAANTLSCYGQPGATKGTLTSAAPGALASLLTALDAYGLITVPPPDITPPQPVTAFVPSSLAPTSMGLNWVNPTDPDFAGVDIRMSLGQDPPATYLDGTLIAELSGAVTFFNFTGLTPNTQYAYSAFARDTAGNHSEKTSFWSPTPYDSGDLTSPGPVTDVVVSEVSQTFMRLSWVNPSGDIYSVLARRLPGPVAPATAFEGTIKYSGPAFAGEPVTQTDNDLTAGMQYSYSVFVFDYSGNASSPVSVTFTTLS